MYSDLNYFLPSLLVSLTILRNYYNNVYRLENVYTLVVWCSFTQSLCFCVYYTIIPWNYYIMWMRFYTYIINLHILHIPLFKCFPNFFRVVESIQIQNFYIARSLEKFQLCSRQYLYTRMCYAYSIFIILYENIKKHSDYKFILLATQKRIRPSAIF